MPVVDTLHKIWPPLFRCSGIDIIYYGLLRFYQLTTLPFFYVRIFRFQFPAHCKYLVVDLLLGITVDHIIISKETNTWIEQALLHRHLWQQYEGVIHLQRYHTGSIGSGQCSRRETAGRLRHEGRCRVKRTHHPNFCIDGIGIDALDVCPVGNLAAKAIALFRERANTYRLVITFKEVCYIDDHRT